MIEKNKKTWDSFVFKQFYSDHPSHGTLHDTVNGIWSKMHRDITVSKMDIFAFLFRISNIFVQNEVVYQNLWQIQGQTKFLLK